jgi:hypothetical protein
MSYEHPDPNLPQANPWIVQIMPVTTPHAFAVFTKPTGEPFKSPVLAWALFEVDDGRQRFREVGALIQITGGKTLELAPENKYFLGLADPVPDFNADDWRGAARALLEQIVLDERHRETNEQSDTSE